MSELSIRDRARIELTVQRVDFALDARIPRARRRQIREELRSNLTEAAKDVGAEAAIRQLGNMKLLARSYVEIHHGRWDFRSGWWAMLITYGVIGVLSLVISFAFSAGVWSSGGHAASYSLWSWFGPFQGSASAHSFEVTLGSPAQVLLMAIAFVLASGHRIFFKRWRRPE